MLQDMYTLYIAKETVHFEEQLFLSYTVYTTFFVERKPSCRTMIISDDCRTRNVIF
jgi:hypothetical protein